METEPLKVLHVDDGDDDPAWGHRIKDIVARIGNALYLRAVPRAVDIFEYCREQCPTIVVLELNLHGDDGYRVASRLQELRQPPRILVITGHITRATIFRISRHSFSGLVWKRDLDAFSDVFRGALVDVLKGNACFPMDFMEAWRALRKQPEAFVKILSNTELDLIPLLSTGASDAAIANETGMTPRAIRFHRNQIVQKLGLDGTPGLMRWAIENGFGLLRPAPPCIPGYLDHPAPRIFVRTRASTSSAVM